MNVGARESQSRGLGMCWLSSPDPLFPTTDETQEDTCRARCFRWALGATEAFRRAFTAARLIPEPRSFTERLPRSGART